MENIIARHNIKILRRGEPVVDRGCNCQGDEICEFGGRCKERNLVYHCKVEVMGPQEVVEKTEGYIGLMSSTGKERLSNHKTSFNLRWHEEDTELSKYIWRLKDMGKKYRLKWEIMAKALPYNPKTDVCNLCNKERYYILCREDLATLNKIRDLTGECRHRKKG